MDFFQHSIESVRQGIKNKDFSCRELTEQYLQHSQKVDTTYRAFLRWRDEALHEAELVDQRVAAGEIARPLEGVPMAIKDNMGLKGEVTTAASKILQDFQSVYTATVVQRLQAAGAIIIGKTNLDEFAMGASTENSAFQETVNPWNSAMIPGGSSGGSAAAVASGQSVAALGSDTGGSIRQPAAMCGVVGMKPSYGRVSRYGLFALASSLDQIGPFARNVKDAARIYQVIAGHDANDATSWPEEVPNILADIDQPLKDVRLGRPKEYFGQGVNPAVAALIDEACKVYEKLGATIIDVTLPHSPEALATYYILQPAEASSNLARYDGIRYGLSRQEGSGLLDVYRQSREAGFGPETKRRIIIGTFSLSSGYTDKYFHQANRVRLLIQEEFHRVFDQVDGLITPTSPTVAWPLGEKTQDPLTMYLADLLTVPANLAQIPALSMPAGFVGGLPVGMQIMTKIGGESTLFRIAQAYEAATDWHQRHPPAPSS